MKNIPYINMFEAEELSMRKVPWMLSLNNNKFCEYSLNIPAEGSLNIPIERSWNVPQEHSENISMER